VGGDDPTKYKRRISEPAWRADSPWAKPLESVCAMAKPKDKYNLFVWTDDDVELLLNFTSRCETMKA